MKQGGLRGLEGAGAAARRFRRQRAFRRSGQPGTDRHADSILFPDLPL